MTAAHPGFDAASVNAVRGARAGELTAVMRSISWLGSPIWLNIVFAVACVTLCLCRAWRSLLFLVLASPGTVLMVQLVKHLVERTRPAGLHLVHAGGASWPSGHASSSAALYGALFLIVVRSGSVHSRVAVRAGALAVCALLALIGFSRVYLGVHYPTDVVAAWLLAAGWLNAARYADRRSADQPVAPQEPVGPASAPSQRW